MGQPAITADLVVVGGGAAGLATAIFSARRRPDARILVLDGAAKLGAKILVSGGGRCNVTNRVVTPDDFSGGSPHVVRRVLSAFSVEQTIRFFEEIGVRLVEEADSGKLFPTTDRARTVLDALLHEAQRLGVRLLTGHRVTDIQVRGGHFDLVARDTTVTAARVALCTGGQSLPKTGSDGFGYHLARRLGHSVVPPTPALVPLVLDGDFHRPLSGISQPVELTVRSSDAKPIRTRGMLLWTHFGVSGPVVLDASRHWHRARVEGRAAEVFVNLLPGEGVPSADAKLLQLAGDHPRMQLGNALARWIPSRVADAVICETGLSASAPMAHLPREDRRRVVAALVQRRLPVRDSRGYAHAEVTAGGVPLDEVDPRSLGSRKCPNLLLAGEILDVDGRIGGFNFQWSWSSAWVAANGW